MDIALSFAAQNPWLLLGIAFYYVFGFTAVREIYTKEEERLGATPFDRLSHVLIFVGLAAWVWPVVWLNWECRLADRVAAERERQQK